MRFAFILIFSFLATVVGSNAEADTFFSDFAFGKGVPFEGMTVVGGLDVTLESINTEPFGSSSFRDNLTHDIASASFNFSQQIRGFALEISRVHANETIFNFNIGLPTELTGDLIIVDGRVTTSNGGDFGSGSLIWSDIDTAVVTFEIDSTPGGSSGAIAFDRFGISLDVLLGDVNLDGFVNLLDVIFFLARLLTGEFQAEADINLDGLVNLGDVAPFVDLLVG